MNDPHQDAEVLHAGAPIESARAVAILVHGRGGAAREFLSLSRWIDLDDVAYLAPQARGNTWYPYSFLAPLEQNQPYIDSAIAKLESIVAGLLGRGVASEKIAIIGFSQGACLSSEYVARHPRRYLGLAALTGGLIGPKDTPRAYDGSLDGTPVFLGASDPDPHVPWWRVEETSRVLSGMGGEVELVRYANQPHMINDDQMEHVKRVVSGQW